MTDQECAHQQLVLLVEPTTRLRCRHCHLTISAEELSGGACPECYERSGRRRKDFEEIALKAGPPQYRCEGCGILVACHPKGRPRVAS